MHGTDIVGYTYDGAAYCRPALKRPLESDMLETFNKRLDALEAKVERITRFILG